MVGGAQSFLFDFEMTKKRKTTKSNHAPKIRNYFRQKAVEKFNGVLTCKRGILLSSYAATHLKTKKYMFHSPTPYIQLSGDEKKYYGNIMYKI